MPQKKAAALPNDKMAKKIVKELQHYFENPKHKFDLNFDLEGTDFQRKVWKALERIPSGKVLSYKDVSDKLASSPRAVGNACRANPIAIVVPCHRVVAKNGMGGYCGKTSGKMLNIKEWLLAHEQA